MFCPQCGKRISANAKFCVHCGQHLNVEAPEVETQIPVVSGQHEKAQSLLSVFFLSVITGGLYQIYWAYKNWFQLDRLKRGKGSPAWYALLSGIFNFSLFRKVKRLVKDSGGKVRYPAILLFVIWWVGALMTRVPPSPSTGYSVASAIIVGVLGSVIMALASLPVQAAMNRYWVAKGGYEKPKPSYALIVVLVVISGLSLAGAFIK